MAEHLAIAAAAAACLWGCTAPLAPIPEPSRPSPRQSAPTATGASTPTLTDPPAQGEPCPHAESADAKRLEYDAFGPAAMSFGLLGQAWWQWDSEGHAFQQDSGTIWVVVHDGLTGDALATRYPVVQDTKCDHRYVALPDARAYLHEHIDELSDAEVPELAPTRAGLQRTLKALDAHFD